MGKALATQINKPGARIADFAPPKVEAMMVPLGPKGGVSQLPVMGGVVVGDRMTKMIKAGDMFAAMFWGTANASVPK